MIKYQYRYVRYHTYKWELLVDMGWVTMTVDDGWAYMLLTNPRQ